MKVRNKSKTRNYNVADPGRGKIAYTEEEFEQHGSGSGVDGKDRGMALFLNPVPAFYETVEDKSGIFVCLH